MNLLKQNSLKSNNIKYYNPYDKFTNNINNKDFETKNFQERLAGSTKKNINNEEDNFSIDFNKYSDRYNKNNNEEKDI